MSPPRVLLGAALCVLLVAPTAGAEDTPQPPSKAAISVYVEQIPTGSGSVAVGSPAGKRSKLPKDVQTKIRETGGSDAAALEDIATASDLGAPDATVQEPAPQAQPEPEPEPEPEPAAPAQTSPAAPRTAAPKPAPEAPSAPRVEERPAVDATAAANRGGWDDGGSGLLGIGAALAAVAIGLIGAAAWLRRGRPGDADDARLG